MKENCGFCENCRQDVPYIVKEEEMETIFHGKIYCYKGKQAYCKKCGRPIYLPEINDSNLIALYDAYRKAEGLISYKDVLEICPMYNIGKQSFGFLLGWGDKAMVRYCKGNVPTKERSKLLQRIHDDPSFYLEVLEVNKGILMSEKIYEKSKTATLELIEKKRG